MTPHDLSEVYIRTVRHGNTSACIKAANAAGAVVIVPTEMEAGRVRKLGARAFSLARGARELVGSSDAFVVDPTVLAVAAAEWSAQVYGLEVERDEATRALADARAEVARLKAENDRLTAELAEAQATLANERGEGEPPVVGWERNDIDTRREGVAWYTRWEADGSEPGEDDTEHTHVAWVRREEGCMVEWMWEIERSLGRLLDQPVMSGRAPTARAAIRDASAAKSPTAP